MDPVYATETTNKYNLLAPRTDFIKNNEVIDESSVIAAGEAFLTLKTRDILNQVT